MPCTPLCSPALLLFSANSGDLHAPLEAIVPWLKLLVVLLKVQGRELNVALEIPGMSYSFGGLLSRSSFLSVFGITGQGEAHALQGCTSTL